MKIFKTATLILFGAIISTSVFSQGVKRSKFEMKSVIYPNAPIKGTQTYVIYIHKGSTGINHQDIDNKKYIKNYEEALGKTSYYTFQNYTLNHTSPSFKIEIAFGDFNAGEKTLKQHNIPCKQEGAKLTKDNIQECPAFYYEVAYTLPAIMKVSDASGKILYMSDIKSEGYETFGYSKSGLSGYLVQAELDKAYNATGISSMKESATRNKLGLLNREVQEAIYFHDITDNFNIATGKGKDHNYTDLEIAQSKALAALKTGTSLATALNPSISAWEKALTEENLSDNKARINRKVATELRFNLALAYMYANDFDNAFINANKGRELARFASNTAITDMANNIYYTIKARNIQYQNNKDISVTGKKIAISSGVLANTIAIKAKDLPYNLVTAENKYAAFATELKTFQANEKESNATTTATNASAGTSTNKWSSSVTKSATQGMIIMLPYRNIKDEDMKDICELTMLNQAVLNNNKITVVPNEISNLAGLDKLQLAANQIKELPESIGKLTKLKNLNISKNPISKFPASMKNLKSLKTLSMKSTNIPQSEIDALQKALPNCKIKF